MSRKRRDWDSARRRSLVSERGCIPYWHQGWSSSCQVSDGERSARIAAKAPASGKTKDPDDGEEKPNEISLELQFDELLPVNHPLFGDQLLVNCFRLELEFTDYRPGHKLLVTKALSLMRYHGRWSFHTAEALLLPEYAKRNTYIYDHPKLITHIDWRPRTNPMTSLAADQIHDLLSCTPLSKAQVSHYLRVAKRADFLSRLELLTSWELEKVPWRNRTG